MRSEIEIKLIEGQKTGIIDLDDMNIDDDELEEILSVLSKNKSTITVINLDNNNLRDKGAAVLADHLSQFFQLEELGLQRNYIGKTGASAIFSLRREHTELRILFHGNQIKNALELVQIEQNALSNNGISP